MTAATKHPVDSATRTCCGGIGTHARNCSAVAPPAGAEPDVWTAEGVREVYQQVGYIAVSTDLLKCPTVTVSAEQRRDGSIGCIDILLDVAMGRSDAALSIAQARELAALLTDAAKVADGWVVR
ncbi:hypothetical protein [Mycolicibacterium vanbaalenii]|uniref:Uncharacterized protein n=1 Tax=Mycolicibacterium vanbaalenii (strain DSM 7251 / JCM 13017 / BCRC 16820 / KCTC 9966 / NRRL B-24157 / PYR-1) TaxID=350058 RepID=A1T544_MYCVP|nr:hypothetical protein [Mycolicibacterium vanbaalenii]ABM12294.1 hypothetical protein Mvan_1461 [Mycolicibacterium vanbaalenii PYR-1]MCV7131027.1 hypothetical protein [Mycolicibacterium vanbaalenii PYR-1]